MILPERLHLDVIVLQGTCCICRTEPRAEALHASFTNDAGERFDVTICRDCLAEYAPNALAEIEAAAAAPALP